MIKARIYAALLVCLTLSLLSATGVVALEPPTDEMAALDVDGYWMTSTNGTGQVDFAGQDGGILATVRVDASDVTKVAIVVESSAPGLQEISIVWNQVVGTLSLNPEGALKRFQAEYDFQTGTWHREPGFEAVFAAHREEVALAALAFDQVTGRPYTPESASGSTCSLASASEPQYVADLNISCNGFQCRGFGLSGSASHCCEDAWQDASNCCSNGLCWGCCRFLACDKGCAGGDYFCFCGVTGISCSYPAY